MMPRPPSWFTRVRWRLGDIWAQQDARLSLGLLALVALAFGGVAAARAVAHASSPAPARAGVRVVTMRQKVKVREHGHLVTRWRTHTIRAQGQTVIQTRTIHTPNGARVVTRPVVRYRVAYRKRVVRVNGKTRTVVQPVTDSRTTTATQTQVVTNTRDVTSTRVTTTTVTQPVTVVETTTVVSTVTAPAVTITVSVPTLP